MSDGNLTDEECSFLLKHARETIRAEIWKEHKAAQGSEASKIGPHLEEHRGCFVTLHKAGKLQGCIGLFESNCALWESVGKMAIQAAFNDPRFCELKAREFDKIDIEISVLSPLREVDSAEKIEVGVHGIYITNGSNRGVLLPQVATEHGWDRDTFLEHTCLKAGLAPEAWKKPDTVIEIFTAKVFGEKEPRYECP